MMEKEALFFFLFLWYLLKTSKTNPKIDILLVYKIMI
jgi:hypothetical protein